MDEEQADRMAPRTLFYSYVEQDEALHLELEKHLRPLQREGTIAGWHYRKIIPGADTEQTSNEQLQTAQLILLLISPDYLASDAAHEEMQRALRRHKAGQAYVIPLLLRPVDWERASITHLRVLPRNGQPVIVWPNRDQAFAHIAQQIRLVVEQLPVSPFPFFFLSYVRKDYKTAENLKSFLMEQAVAGWVDQQALLSGHSGEERLREAMREASAVILVGTPDTQSSSSVKLALQIAEMYQRTIYVLWVAGNQLDEVMPVGCHGFSTFDARGQRYEEALEELLQTFRKQTITSPAGGLLTEEANSSGMTVRNPYKGLHAFRQEDAQDFFGRERLIDELVEKVHQMLAPSPSGEVVARLLTVVGASGSGKSSVVMAGLLPKLQQGVSSEHWIYLDPIVPGQDPVEALLLTLSPLFPVRSLKSLRDDLEDDSTRGLHLLLTTYVRQATAKVVLLVDQFEELFTQTSTEEERRRFLDLLLTAVTEPNGPLIVVLTLRADFYDRPLQYPELGYLIKSHQVVVFPMEMPDLRKVIEQPAQLPDVQLTFEEDLVGDLLFEVQGQVGALLLLQFTLDQLFQRRMGQILTRRAYLEIGGVRGALASHAELTFHSLPTPVHQRLARALFLRLINPGTVEQDATKRRVPLSALRVIDPEETDMLAKVAQDFTQARLLTTNTVHEVATIEVSHEALINAWSRLAEWLHEGRNDIRLQQAIGEDAAEWLRHGEPTDRLYRGTQLTEALAWREANIPNLDEDRFLHASVQEHQRVQRRERRQRTRRRLLLAGLIAGVGVAPIGWLVYILRLFAPSSSPSPPLSSPHLGLPYTYNGHTDAVVSVAWSPDGKCIASASSNMVRIWDVSSTITLATYKGHTKAISSIAWSPDGKRIASASDDKTVQIWDANSATPLFTYKGHTKGVSSIAWSPDGKHIISADLGSVVHVWDVSNSNIPPLTYKGHASSVVRSVTWSPDSKRIASASDDKTVQIWDAGSATTLLIYKGHANDVRSVAWSPDGSRIASASGAVQVWDASSGTSLFTYKGYTSSVTSIAWSPNGNFIASGSGDKTVQVWDASSGAPLFTYDGHVDTVLSVTWSPDNKRIASSGRDKTVQVWDASTSNIPLLTYKGHPDAVLSVAWSPDGKRIASGSGDKTVQVWDASSGASLSTYKGLLDDVSGIAWSPDGSRIAFASGAAQVWDASSGTVPLLTYDEHAYAVSSVAWSPDGKRIASAGGHDKTVHVWDANGATTLFIYRGHTNDVSGVAWSPDGKRIASASEDRTVQIWDAGSATTLLVYNGHADRVYSVAWSPDGKRLASACLDGTVHVWDANNATTLLIYKEHTNIVEYVAWSPDGKRIASGGWDKVLRVWDARSATTLFTYRGHTDWVQSVAWSPDGKRIASASSDHTVKIWYARA